VRSPLAISQGCVTPFGPENSKKEREMQKIIKKMGCVKGLIIFWVPA
jgi:hypothetical protein